MHDRIINEGDTELDIFIFRHAQGYNNLPVSSHPLAADEIRHRLDAPLTDRGHTQAHYLADYVSAQWNEEEYGEYGRVSFWFSHLYASPMHRTADTAYALSRKLDIPITFEPLIHECGGLSHPEEDGTIVTVPGLPRSFYRTHYENAVIPTEITEEGWWKSDRPETSADWDERARLWLSKAKELHGGEGESIAIVTHQGFFQALMRQLLDAVGRPLWFTMLNTGATRVHLGPDGQTVFRFVNHLAHLPHDLITG